MKYKKNHIYFPSSIFRISKLENFIFHKYIVANLSGHTVKAVGCNYFISEIAGSNPADGMDVFRFVFSVRGPCDGLITGMEGSLRVCLFSRTSNTTFRSQWHFPNLTQNTSCYTHSASPPISSSLHPQPPTSNSNVVTAALLIIA